LTGFALSFVSLTHDCTGAMWLLFNIFCLILAQKAASEWPDCGNFAFAKGYPIGEHILLAL
jgi:hypothetical protein